MFEFINPILEVIKSILHIDVTLLQWAQTYGSAIYVILFLIIFCETGLVVTPFLPGDSLLFAVGAASAIQLIRIEYIIPLLIVSAILGDSTNYIIGLKWGRRFFFKDTFFVKKKYLTDAEIFFQKNGKWAVSLARFIPITRTMAPFFAGLSQMRYMSFLFFSVFGTLIWINLFVLAGYFFGQIDVIKRNFTYLVFGIIFVSILPIIIPALKSKFRKNF